jgi:hypothetical protein
MTPNILIEILRKLEDSPNNNLNLQQFVTSMVHRFKQDGIIRKIINNIHLNAMSVFDLLWFTAAQSVGNINSDIIRHRWVEF